MMGNYINGDGPGYTPGKKRMYEAMNMTNYNYLIIGKENVGSYYDMRNGKGPSTGFEYEGKTVEFLKL